MADVQSDTIKSLLEAAVEVARLAGQLFTAGFRDRETLIRGIQTKSSAADLVTATDKAVETFIFEELRKRFATHKFVGEEGIAGPTQWPEDDTPVWIVDPVDGTLNFAHGLEPFTCISIACAIGKRPVVGVVYAPLVDQLFSAGRGLGAFLNSSPLPTFAHFPPLALASALVVTEFGHAHEPEIQAPKQKAISKLIGNCRGIRCFGSAAMNMCYVAKGSCDAYYEAGIHSWVGSESLLAEVNSHSRS